MKKNYPSILSLILIASISLFGCKKTQEDYTSTAESAEAFAHDQPLIMSMVDMIDDFLGNQNFMQKNGNSILPDDVIINYIDTSFDDNDGIEILLDFGDDPGKYCGDGITRSGAILIRTDKPFAESGSKTEIIIDKPLKLRTTETKPDFTFTIAKSNLNKIELRRINQAAHEFSYTIIGGLSNKNDVSAGDFSGQFIIEKIEGVWTPEFTDDIYIISSEIYSWLMRENTKYSVQLVETLIKNPCSKIFTKGKLTLNNQGNKVKLEINFGDGTCDNKIEVKSGAFKKEITL